MTSQRHTVCVVGLGYVGLPLAVALARAGHAVLGVDLRADIVASINRGDLTGVEADVTAAFREPGTRARFRAQFTPAPADVFVIAVPTPLRPDAPVADLRAVEAATAAIAPHLRPGNLVIVESTVPPLTCRTVVAPIIERHGLRVGDDVLLAHCPERVLPGALLPELIHNDRIIGGVTPEAARRAHALYASFVTGDLLITDDVTAELCKLMENAYRDVNIALANEYATIAETLGVDVLGAIALANRHPRVNILRPGIGVGGHCIPVDPWFIHQIAPAQAPLIEAARRVNDAVPARIAAKIAAAVAGTAEPVIALVGAGYKPNSADCRESPAIGIVAHLRARGLDPILYDPLAAGHPWPDGGLTAVARGADCLAILVEHDSVRRELLEHEGTILAAMRSPALLRFYPTALDPRPDPAVAPLAAD